jgi:hypothetical protein
VGGVRPGDGSPGGCVVRIAILCPGPSLKVTWSWRKGTYDLIIGVNAAVEFWPCDWWCVGDWEALTWYKRSPNIGICSIRDALRHVREKTIALKFPWESLQMISWEDLAIHQRFSSIMALGLANTLGATRVDYFGDDKAGNTDYTGQIDPLRSTAGPAGNDRWGDERAQLALALEWARQQGLEVSWVKPAA